METTSTYSRPVLGEAANLRKAPEPAQEPWETHARSLRELRSARPGEPPPTEASARSSARSNNIAARPSRGSPAAAFFAKLG